MQFELVKNPLNWQLQLIILKVDKIVHRNCLDNWCGVFIVIDVLHKFFVREIFKLKMNERELEIRFRSTNLDFGSAPTWLLVDRRLQAAELLCQIFWQRSGSS